jgi:hypothetical protein
MYAVLELIKNSEEYLNTISTRPLGNLQKKLFLTLNFPQGKCFMSNDENEDTTCMLF